MELNDDMIFFDAVQNMQDIVEKNITVEKTPVPVEAVYFEQFSFFSTYNPMYEYTMGRGNLKSFLEARATPCSRENGDIKSFYAERADGTGDFFLFSPTGEIYRENEVSTKTRMEWAKIPATEWKTELLTIYHF